MKKTWMLLGLLSATLAVQAAPVCEVMAVLGEAQVNGKALKVGAQLEVGVEVQTSAKGRVRLRFVDGSTLVVSDGSRLRIERFEAAAGDKPREVSLRLELGLIGQKVAPGGGWEVRTPTAVTAVRGTEFMVEVGGDETTAVHVQTGQVAVQSSRRTRSATPRPAVLLDRQSDGTQCSNLGCEESKRWGEARVKSMQDRLGGF
ncbi:FecR domain-containing protein [Pelomonas sp. SE-A7]|uniref:FecR family protein n=1 Tax=Pelomonas sp. SE-A7 TaxID=3054953 RepID=UPI00259C6A88|nr:FecR domain-containing protein [Pelomonas sp. SE-A7]MDM4766116.1 FecR domain-containing protein [Pelomonas sp. SE-A7]